MCPRNGSKNSLNPCRMMNGSGRDDFAANANGVKVEDTGRLKLNPEWKSNPHSATGYLRVPEVVSV